MNIVQLLLRHNYCVGRWQESWMSPKELCHSISRYYGKLDFSGAGERAILCTMMSTGTRSGSWQRRSKGWPQWSGYPALRLEADVSPQAKGGLWMRSKATVMEQARVVTAMILGDKHDEHH